MLDCVAEVCGALHEAAKKRPTDNRSELQASALVSNDRFRRNRVLWEA